jgi:hypothetical protein
LLPVLLALLDASGAGVVGAVEAVGNDCEASGNMDGSGMSEGPVALEPSSADAMGALAVGESPESSAGDVFPSSVDWVQATAKLAAHAARATYRLGGNENTE